MPDDPSLNSLRHGTCPDCRARAFWPGPRGGAAINVECVKCGARFNVTIVDPAPVPIAVFMERIPRRDEGGAEWPPAAHTIGWGPG